MCANNGISRPNVFFFLLAHLVDQPNFNRNSGVEHGLQQVQQKAAGQNVHQHFTSNKGNVHGGHNSNGYSVGGSAGKGAGLAFDGGSAGSSAGYTGSESGSSSSTAGGSGSFGKSSSSSTGSATFRRDGGGDDDDQHEDN